jgi:hypothetical protein
MTRRWMVITIVAALVIQVGLIGGIFTVVWQATADRRHAQQVMAEVFAESACEKAVQKQFAFVSPADLRTSDARRGHGGVWSMRVTVDGAPDGHRLWSCTATPQGNVEYTARAVPAG